MLVQSTCASQAQMHHSHNCYNLIDLTSTKFYDLMKLLEINVPVYNCTWFDLCFGVGKFYMARFTVH